MKLSALTPLFLLTLSTLTACSGGDETAPAPAKDTIAPVITLMGDSALTLSVGSAYAEPGATASDATDGTVPVTTTGTVDSAAVNSYTLTYSATDAAGNQSSKTRTVNVVDDSAPVLVINGDTPLSHNAGDVYTDLGAMVSDNVDEASSITITTTGVVNADVIGSYSVTYTASDAAGNAATPVVRTVNVADLTAPVITLIGVAVIEHNYGDPYTDAGASATDNIDATVTVTTTGGVTTDMINSYTITYTATDEAGNEALPVERTVTVADIKGPVITLNGESIITLGQGRDYNELGATALDVFDNEVIVIAGPIEPVGTVDNTTIEKYELTYIATDVAGNTSKLVRTVDVVAPRPFITTWKTTADNESIAIGTDPVTYSTYNFDVDWGDGTPPENFQAVYFASHIYTKAGTYTVTINGVLPKVNMKLKGFKDNNLKLININQWGDIAWESMAGSFQECVNVTSDATDIPDLRLVTSMNNMFREAATFNADISDWDVSSVIVFQDMFNGASAFNQDLSLWELNSVDIMADMFRDSNMSTVNNDALLQTWSLQAIQHDLNGVILGLGSNGYSASSDAAVENLLNNYSWTISTL